MAAQTRTTLTHARTCAATLKLFCYGSYVCSPSSVFPPPAEVRRGAWTRAGSEGCVAEIKYGRTAGGTSGTGTLIGSGTDAAVASIQKFDGGHTVRPEGASAPGESQASDRSLLVSHCERAVQQSQVSVDSSRDSTHLHNRTPAPTTVKMDETGFSAQLTRSKTLGSDRTVASRPLVIDRCCHLAVAGWMQEGRRLLKDMADYARDYLIPSPSSNGDGCRRRELSYDTASAMQNSLAHGQIG